MNHDASLPESLNQRKASADPGGREGQRRKHVPIRQRTTNGIFPRNRISELRARNVKLAGEGQPDQRPKDKQRRPLDPRFMQESLQRHAGKFLTESRKLTG